MMGTHFFTKDEVEVKMKNIINKTLGEVDVNNVFEKTVGKPKITGIAGDVIEQSVFNYPQDSKQEADLSIDGLSTELKVTGIRPSKKNQNLFEAKEPMSITAVSINNIIHEEFENSKFWAKVQNTLLVYYEYASDDRVFSYEYKRFPIRAYQFHTFHGIEKERLKHDWVLVRDFIININKEYECPEKEYYRLSSELRPNLLYLDTAPKYPNPPRFRLKRSVVSRILQEHMNNIQIEKLSCKYVSYKDIDIKCNHLTMTYRGLKISDIERKLLLSSNLEKKINKAVAEPIISRMFGAQSMKLNNIDLFRSSGIIGKSIVLNSKGARTEDTKLFKIDFEEWLKEGAIFEESMIYEYFKNHQFLFIVFKECREKSLMCENIFQGFKRLAFTDEFIDTIVKDIWHQVRNLINNNLLEEEIIYLRDTNKPRVNASGNIMTNINFPKAKDSVIFLRGSGKDSDNKPLKINGISMYNQYIWIKGIYLVELLKEIEYL